MNCYIGCDLGGYYPEDKMLVFESYETHDNGGRPFLVEFSEDHKRVQVRKILDGEYDEQNYEIEPCLTVYPTKVFIGDGEIYYSEPDSAFSKGNSILLHVYQDLYIYIGICVKIFKSLAPIQSYVSPIGNSDVVYPYAVDEDDNYYLIIENVVLVSPTIPPVINDGPYKYSDPYSHYYEDHLMGVNLGRVPQGNSKHSEFMGGIDHLKIGEEIWTLNLNMTPGYEYDRLTKDDHYGNVDGNQVPTLHFLDKDRAPQPLSRQAYIDMMNEYAELIGVTTLTYNKVIIGRPGW